MLWVLYSHLHLKSYVFVMAAVSYYVVQATVPFMVVTSHLLQAQVSLWADSTFTWSVLFFSSNKKSHFKLAFNTQVS